MQMKRWLRMGGALLAALVLAAWSPPATRGLGNGGQTLVVDNNSDSAGQACTAAAGDCSLRSAIGLANAAPGSTILFDGAARQINLGSILPTISAAGTVVRATTGQTIEVHARNAAFGLRLAGDEIRVEGLHVYSATINLNVSLGAGQQVYLKGNVIGNDETAGCEVTGSDYGIRVQPNATTPPDAASRIFIYGNRVECNRGAPGVGVSLDGVRGAFVGQDEAGAAGTAQANTLQRNDVGIELEDGATQNLVKNNRIILNLGDGVHLDGAATAANTIIRNHIGTGDGIQDNGNGGDGIDIDAAVNNQIGAAPPDRNIISGNDQNGIELSEGAAGNRIQGNYIGVSADGHAVLPNGTTASGATSRNGIRLAGGSRGNLIGGTDLGQLNLIGGNLGNGILIDGSGTTTNTVQLNDIGFNSVDRSANQVLPNGNHGILIMGGAAQNLIGPAAAAPPIGLSARLAPGRLLALDPAANIVAFNTRAGIRIEDSNGNQVRANSFNFNQYGVELIDARSNVVQRALIASSQSYGIYEQGTQSNIWSEVTFVDNRGQAIKQTSLATAPPAVTGFLRSPAGVTAVQGSSSQSGAIIEVYASSLSPTAADARFVGRTTTNSSGRWMFAFAQIVSTDLPGSCLTAFQTIPGGLARSTEFATRRACRTFLPGLSR
ncbi:MAG TPA: right-handed parallel beta-helix repeat-containing protein [Herpetosiphonaceae bacterium]